MLQRPRADSTADFADPSPSCPHAWLKSARIFDLPRIGLYRHPVEPWGGPGRDAEAMFTGALDEVLSNSIGRRPTACFYAYSVLDRDTGEPVWGGGTQPCLSPETLAATRAVKCEVQVQVICIELAPDAELPAELRPHVRFRVSGKRLVGWVLEASVTPEKAEGLALELHARLTDAGLEARAIPWHEPIPLPFAAPGLDPELRIDYLQERLAVQGGAA